MAKSDDNIVDVGIKIPLEELLNGNPEELRKQFGEEIYRQALLKAPRQEGPRELRAIDSAQ